MQIIYRCFDVIYWNTWIFVVSMTGTANHLIAHNQIIGILVDEDVQIN